MKVFSSEKVAEDTRFIGLREGDDEERIA